MNDDIIIYDTVQAWTIEDGDQILVFNDPIEVSSATPISDGNMLVRGFSHESGDEAEYILNQYYMVPLWTV